MNSRIPLARPHRLPPRLELTPLIDCVFLLLIFFLLTSSFSKQNMIQVNLPHIQGEQEAPPDASILTLQIDAAGKMLIDEKSLTIEDVKTYFTKLAETDPEQHIRILTDEAAPAGSVITALDEARQAGLSAVDIVGDNAQKK